LPCSGDCPRGLHRHESLAVGRAPACLPGPLTRNVATCSLISTSDLAPPMPHTAFPSSIFWSCLPWLGWLVVGLIGLAVTLWFARADFPRAISSPGVLWGRLRSLHRCETGAV